MTYAQIVRMFHEFIRDNYGNYPTHWFISASTWRELFYGADEEFYRYTKMSNYENKLLGLPAYRVIEAGIFECH